MNKLNLTWRDVFDGSKFRPGMHVHEAVELVWAVHYSYLAWNGKVYKIHRGSSGFLEWDDTEIFDDEL